MKVEIDLPQGLTQELKAVILAATEEALVIHQQKLASKTWLSLKEGCQYAGVSNNTFARFREMGLKVCEIEGIKRVSRFEIDNFLERNSF